MGAHHTVPSQHAYELGNGPTRSVEHRNPPHGPMAQRGLCGTFSPFWPRWLPTLSPRPPATSCGLAMVRAGPPPIPPRFLYLSELTRRTTISAQLSTVGTVRHTPLPCGLSWEKRNCPSPAFFSCRCCSHPPLSRSLSWASRHHHPTPTIVRRPKQTSGSPQCNVSHACSSRSITPVASRQSVHSHFGMPKMFVVCI